MYHQNFVLQAMCYQNNWKYIDNYYIDIKWLYDDGLQLIGMESELSTSPLTKGIKDLFNYHQENVELDQGISNVRMNNFCKSSLKVTLLNVRSLKTVNRSMNKIVQLQNLAACRDVA